MPGTKAGAAKAAATIKKKHGEDFFRNIGKAGGQAGNTGGFASKKVGRDGLTGQQRAARVGAIGGAISRRKPKVVEPVEETVEEPKTSIWDRLRVKKGSA